MFRLLEIDHANAHHSQPDIRPVVDKHRIARDGKMMHAGVEARAPAPLGMPVLQAPDAVCGQHVNGRDPRLRQRVVMRGLGQAFIDVADPVAIGIGEDVDELDPVPNRRSPVRAKGSGDRLCCPD